MTVRVRVSLSPRDMAASRSASDDSHGEQGSTTVISLEGWSPATELLRISGAYNGEVPRRVDPT